MKRETSAVGIRIYKGEERRVTCRKALLSEGSHLVLW